MNRFRALSLLSLTTLVVVPFFAHAADLPLFSAGWSLVPEACRDCACGFAGVMGIVQNLMNAGISVAILFAVIIIAWAGLLYITTPANPEARSQANKMLMNAVVGMLIVLSAWLIVDFVMKILYNPNNAGWGPWNNIISGGDVCVSSIETKPLFSGPITAGTLTTTTGTTGGTLPSGGGPGSCAVRTSGGCAYQNFVGPFGSEAVARQASQVCYGESTGNAANVSLTDRMRNDPQRRAFSFGLFQVNLTVHKMAGLNCPDAFRGTNYSAVVTDENLYARCVAAAKVSSNNIAAAVKIYNDAHGWGPWSAAKICGLADAGHAEYRLAIGNLVRSAVSLLP